MTELVFRDDAYARSCAARVTRPMRAASALDRTVFYPTGGGQPGDTGILRLASGATIAIADTVKGEGPRRGDPCSRAGGCIARTRRRGHRRDRLGAAPPADADAHLPAPALRGRPGAVTGGQVSDGGAGSISMCPGQASTARRSPRPSTS